MDTIGDVLNFARGIAQTIELLGSNEEFSFEFSMRVRDIGEAFRKERNLTPSQMERADRGLALGPNSQYLFTQLKQWCKYKAGLGEGEPKISNRESEQSRESVKNGE